MSKELRETLLREVAEWKRKIVAIDEERAKACKFLQLRESTLWEEEILDGVPHALPAPSGEDDAHRVTSNRFANMPVLVAVEKYLTERGEPRRIEDIVEALMAGGNQINKGRKGNIEAGIKVGLGENNGRLTSKDDMIGLRIWEKSKPKKSSR